MSIMPDDSKLLSFGSLDEKMNIEQRRKRGMIFREVILFCWREIKRRWKREIIFGAEESKSKKNNSERPVDALAVKTSLTHLRTT